MSLKVFLSCDQSFRNKARYVFRTFGDILGEEIRFVTPEECSDADIVLCYGRIEDIHHIPGRHIIINAHEGAWELFRRGRRYEHTDAVACTIEGEPSLALFFDREFASNPEAVASGAGREIIIHVDIVAGTFFFLSGWQEYTSDVRDMHQRYPAAESIQEAFGLHESPVVEHYAALLANALHHMDWEEPFTGRYHNKLFSVMMTHDIDHLRKWTMGMIYREVVRYFLANRLNKRPAKRFSRVGKFLVSLLRNRDPYRYSLDQILAIEEKSGAHATFFFLPKGKDKRDGKYSFDHPYTRGIFDRLKKSGHEIGLHPTYLAYDQADIMRAEKELLASATGITPLGVREHFLRFHMQKTWKIQEVLEFKYDATLGFAPHEGFRMGICHPFHAYDIAMDSPLGLWEIPLLVMDDTLKSYRELPPAEAYRQIEKILTTVRKFGGVAVLLFHNACFDEFDFPGWDDVYRRTMQWCYDNDADMLSGRELLELYPING